MNARQERERLADIEAAYQRAAWSLTTVQAAGLAKVNPYPFDGVLISGDHRPRHGRLYYRGDVVDWREQQGLTGRARHFGGLDEDGM